MPGRNRRRTAARNRAKFLKLVTNTWTRGVLDKSLRRSVLIELGLGDRADILAHPWKVYTPDDRDTSIHARLIDVLDESNGSLLILGAPGAGKTTMRLDLAPDNGHRAEQDHEAPIPVVFNLSTWASKRPPISTWAACVDPINSSCRGALMPVVVCSRTVDYAAVKTRLELRRGVALRAPSIEEVTGHLDAVGQTTAMRRASSLESPALAQLARTPLVLGVMMAMADANETAAPPDLREIHRRYVRTVLRRRGMEGRWSP